LDSNILIWKSPLEPLACLLPLFMPLPRFRAGGVENVGTHFAVLEFASADSSAWVKGDHELGLITGAGTLPDGTSEVHAVGNRCA
jgi:hypothetical protein